MSFLGGIGKVLGGIGKVVGAIASIAGRIMNSPLGNLLKLAFPPLAGAGAAMSLVGMFGNLASSIGGGQNY